MTNQAPQKVTLVEEAVNEFLLETERKKQKGSQYPKRVITISRQLGSGGERIAEVLTQCLGWPLWDKNILDVMASRSHIGFQAKMFEAVDEKYQNEIEALLSDLVGERDKYAYQYLLPKALFVIAQNDAIIFGRGGYIFLPESFRIRIKGSFDTRVKNLQRHERLGEKAAQDKILAFEKNRELFIKEVVKNLGKKYSAWKNEPHFDLEINTDRLSIDDAALLILMAAKNKFGLTLNLEQISKSLTQ
jgi:cytidylate kinase